MRKRVAQQKMEFSRQILQLKMRRLFSSFYNHKLLTDFFFSIIIIAAIFLKDIYNK